MHEPIAFDSADGTRLAAQYWTTSGARGAVVIVHGLGSRKENHADFAIACRHAGLAALTLDVRGHGESSGVLGAAAIDDIRVAADVLRQYGHTHIGLRGSSLGGFLVLAAADRDSGVRCVVAICPARPEALAQRVGDPWPLRYPLDRVVAHRDGIARGYWHATGDAQVPWWSTYALAQQTPQPRHLRIVLGGSHQSLQHDPQVIDDSRAFLRAHLT